MLIEITKMTNKHIEIERKFLINFKSEGFALNEILNKICSKSFRIIQGYLCADTSRTIRVRIKGEKGFLTIKGAANNNGFSRFEWEKEIDIEEAKQLLHLCKAGIIDKTRYEVIYEDKTFEIDQFHGENEGLIFAELELASENEPFIKPEWLGKEVTQDKRYYNSYISQNPYKNWK